MWERYCRGVSCIVYMVDAADHERLEGSKQELHNLLAKPQLCGIPVRNSAFHGVCMLDNNDIPYKCVK